MRTKNSENTGYSIYHDLFINVPIERVYLGISDPDYLINWWPRRCSGIPEENQLYHFFFTKEYDWYGKVKKAEKDKSFHIKMTKSDADWDPTSFGFELEQINGGVRVSFSHTGWPSCNEHFRRSSYCWAMLLNGLKNYLEKGIIIPFEERE